MASGEAENTVEELPWETGVGSKTQPSPVASVPGLHQGCQVIVLSSWTSSRPFSPQGTQELENSNSTLVHIFSLLYFLDLSFILCILLCEIYVVVFFVFFFLLQRLERIMPFFEIYQWISSSFLKISFCYVLAFCSYSNQEWTVISGVLTIQGTRFSMVVFPCLDTLLLPVKYKLGFLYNLLKNH